jgi:hypothetical protein
MSEPFESEPINPDLEEFGLFYDRAKQCVVWEETFGSDPDSEWSRAVEARQAAADTAFLASCGIAEWVNDADV